MSLSTWRGAFGRCTFTATRLPVREHGAVHLPDRGGRHRLLVELEEEPLDRLLQILADHPLDVGERERRARRPGGRAARR